MHGHRKAFRVLAKVFRQAAAPAARSAVEMPEIARYFLGLTMATIDAWATQAAES